MHRSTTSALVGAPATPRAGRADQVREHRAARLHRWFEAQRLRERAPARTGRGAAVHRATGPGAAGIASSGQSTDTATGTPTAST
ncbi:hypothetical protein CLV63_1292 [Murinocardiopsis flavida]|uniref:Uncharacterized protein n=1 Tax=Murinocardiopsis flavida TaxID=645275 RepID=A0A2P8CUS9_9ACTN|nr:hypothetical protein [Murinocardiopsis flavida]PSK88716.1 hypothetical protein CLV63_1292 [Murinocardiopsis flavida]